MRLSTRTSTPLLVLALSALPQVYPWSCSFTASNIPYDLDPLSGLRYASRSSSTPPTTSEARVMFDLCSESGINREGGVADEDQCPERTRVCLKLLNNKPSASDPERITAVVPIWKVDTPDDSISTSPIGKNGQDGLNIYVQGDDYAGTRQSLNLTLHCDQSASDPEPTLVSYQPGLLSLEWSTPDACPRNSEGDSDGGGGNGTEGNGKSGVGFFGFLKALFWLLVIGLILYFAVGIFYNHQQYSAKGWDLIPHRDFWRDVPVLVQDLLSHMFSGIRGGGGRGGYNSLG
ncbi:autophagy-related protein 27 [Naematelia encephala]|uniref:Autophagy-related protein 27 n=1 Tax=Naematelia encephala TaxID=71784 RepID=A0A1Y2B9Z8_9TREE|nr:autophagy-related protein 27 [Naematelia encephala]